MKVLITGISGKLGRMVARGFLAREHEVVGIDRRPWPDAPDGVRMFPADIRKRNAEDVFRVERPEAVIHMATVTHLNTRRTSERFRINLGGTRSVFEYASTYGTEHVIFVGRHTYYGAAPDSPLYHDESEPPMAVSTYPELADLVAADLYAGSALWRFPDMKTCVLRVCYTLGPSRHGTLASYLRGPRVPGVLGYDPLFQFMHEKDVVSALVAALDSKLAGVYNVAGPQPVPLSTLSRVTGRTYLPLPEMILKRSFGRFGLPRLPPGAIGHIKYPVVVDSSAFKDATKWEHTYDEVQTMEAFRWA